MNTENTAPAKPFRYLSVCSGMEAASVAWHPLGWEAAGFAEIEPFPCAILKHRFPNTPNYGDLTQYHTWPIEPGTIDLLVGGPPCAAFSVAGLRKGLEDPRGNLSLTYLGLVDKLRPKWVVYENVPGLLSVDGGRAFGSLLGALGQLGYGWAYRVCDAQYYGVPQRRRRIFLVGHLGDWRAPAEVLSLAEGLRGYLEARRKKGQGAPSGPAGGVDADGRQGVIPYRKAKRAQSTTDDESWVEGEVSNTLNNFDLGDTRTTHAVVYENHAQDSRVKQVDKVSLHAKAGTGGGNLPLTQTSMAVRRLTPVECERLQGFPDNWSRIPWKGKPEEDCPDGPRYKACGNSMAVPVMRWIGERIKAHEAS